MIQNEIIALRCPSCGGSPSEPSREMSFGTEFRCNHCGVTSVMIIDKALVPLSTLMKLGEKVCTKCGRMALREARFCQAGHSLVQQCQLCSKEFTVDHERCDFCGMLQLKLNSVHQGIVSHVNVVHALALVNINGRSTMLALEEIANHSIKNIHDELKVGEQITVKIINTHDNDIKVSLKALGRP